MAATVTAAARVIAAAAYAAVAVLTVIPGVKSGSKTVLGIAIIEAASWLTVGVLYLTVPAEHIFLPLLLGIALWAIPTPRQTNKQGQ